MNNHLAEPFKSLLNAFSRPRLTKVVTHFVFPPIPDRSNDWQAIYDGDEPNDNGSMAIGRGATEIAATLDLLENYPRENVECLDCSGKGHIAFFTCANCEGTGKQPIIS